MAVEDAYELAYREAVRALDHQRATVTELRNRAGILLATASIVISLLGEGAFRGMQSLAWVAIVCFALLSICLLAIVWPHADWSFDTDPQKLLSEHLSTATPNATALSSDLVVHLAMHRRANGLQIARMTRAFRVGACLLAIQIVLTIVAVGATV